jgi:hypothetical protein
MDAKEATIVSEMPDQQPNSVNKKGYTLEQREDPSFSDPWSVIASVGL